MVTVYVRSFIVITPIPTAYGPIESPDRVPESV